LLGNAADDGTPIARAAACAARSLLYFDQHAFRSGRRWARQAILHSIEHEKNLRGTCIWESGAIDHALREPTRAELELGIRRIMRALGVETWTWDRPDFAVMDAVGRRAEAAHGGKDNRATGRVDAGRKGT